MNITSPAFPNFGTIPQEYSCRGRGTNPPLHIEDIPPGAQTLALIVDDPDTPNGMFDHWLLWNIETYTTDIEPGSSPPNAEVGLNSDGRAEFYPFCPDSGVHHYRFELSALSQKLELPSGANRKELMEAMKDFIIGRAELVGEMDAGVEL
jgi:Raf kinase inhibitor-like YbhB/YbcL family protein